MPTPIEPVKYSMFNAYAAVTGAFLVLFRKDNGSKPILSLTIIGTAFILILLHVLAVRTGIIIVYISLVVFVFKYVLTRLPSSRAWPVILALIILPFLLYLFVPSIKQKMGYMQYDWGQHEVSKGDHYSDSERIMSYKAAWSIWKQSPVMGIGYGDVRDAANEYYSNEYQRADLFKLPHSQFLLTLAGVGVLGMFMFVAGFYIPFVQFRGSGLILGLLSMLFLNYTLSFFVENSLERSMSVAYFIVLALVMIKSLNDQRVMEEAEVEKMK